MKRNHLPGSIWRHPVYFLACGCGSGAAPWAPGTFGTLVAIPVWYVLATSLSVYWQLAVIVGLFLLGIYLCAATAKHLNVPDHSGIVWDEIVGFLITMLAVPVTWYWMLAGFALFRFFDIVKPWPIRTVDRKLHGGLGIMLDDVIAGVYALLILHLIVYLSS